MRDTSQVSKCYLKILVLEPNSAKYEEMNVDKHVITLVTCE
jgi:hypothetical protein